LGIETPEVELPLTSMPDRPRAEPGSRSVGYGRVEGHPDDSKVVRFAWVDEAFGMWQVRERHDPTERVLCFLSLTTALSV